MGQGFYDLKVNPANNKHLLAATNGGLYVSHDGGVNWTQKRSAVTWSIDIAAGGGAGAEILAACSDGVWRSTNGGNTWAAVALPGGLASYNRLAVAIAPSNPAVAYAWGAQGANAYVWRRSGGVWTTGTLPAGGVSTGQAWYDWYVASAPDIDTQVYCAAIDLYRADISGARGLGQISRPKAAADSRFIRTSTRSHLNRATPARFTRVATADYSVARIKASHGRI